MSTWVFQQVSLQLHSYSGQIRERVPQAQSREQDKAETLREKKDIKQKIQKDGAKSSQELALRLDWATTVWEEGIDLKIQKLRRVKSFPFTTAWALIDS